MRYPLPCRAPFAVIGSCWWARRPWGYSRDSLQYPEKHCATEVLLHPSATEVLLHPSRDRGVHLAWATKNLSAPKSETVLIRLGCWYFCTSGAYPWCGDRKVPRYQGPPRWLLKRRRGGPWAPPPRFVILKASCFLLRFWCWNRFSCLLLVQVCALGNLYAALALQISATVCLDTVSSSLVFSLSLFLVCVRCLGVFVLFGQSF